MPGQLRTVPLSIAAVGVTVDGREITEKDINDIVETYNPDMYGARINIDHYGDWSGWKAEALSAVQLNGGMLGDVLEVTTEKNADGVQVLNAVLAPNASFVQLNQADQHVYFSMEIDRDFRGTGKTYLTGLAVTDYPASTYTSRAKFSSESRAKENMDVSFIVDLGVKQQLAKPKAKTSIFERLFNKQEPKDNDMDETKLAAALASEFGKLLAPVTEQLTALHSKIDESKAGSDSGQPDEGQGSDAQNTELTEQLTQLTAQVKTLNDKVVELSKNPAPGTTAADDEITGDDGKYANLL